MINITKALKGRLSEAVRSQVTHALTKVVKENLPENLNDWWKNRGKAQFLMDCEVEADPATVPDDIALVSTNALAEYFNKWNRVMAYRDDDEWVDIEGPMLHLKSTMLEELRTITR